MALRAGEYRPRGALYVNAAASRTHRSPEATGTEVRLRQPIFTVMA